MDERIGNDRPVIFDYRAIPQFLGDMLDWQRQQDAAFSIRQATAPLRRCSPSLVTRVVQGKRRLTADRVEDFSKLLKLNAEERSYFEQWVLNGERVKIHSDKTLVRQPLRHRKGKQNHLLSDWLNVYVKDACRLRGFQAKAKIVHRLLGGIASVNRIQKSLDFLFREGFLRRTISGKIIENDFLVTTTDEELNRKIQAFHRRALEIARRNITLYPLSRRRESVLVLRLNEKSVAALKELLKEFYEKLLVFAEQHTEDDESLYQILINLTPIGGKQQ